MKKKLMSVLLTVAVIIAYSVPAFATPTRDANAEAWLPSDAKKSEEVCDVDLGMVENADVEEVQEVLDAEGFEDVSAEQVIEDVLNLESVGFETDDLELDPNSDGEATVYNFNVTDATQDQIEVDEKGNGDLVLDFNENGVSNTLEIKQNGDLILDGKKVVIEESTVSLDEEDLIVVPNGRDSRYRTSSPYKGKDSDYTKFIKKYKSNDINAGKKISSIGIGVIATILCSAINAGLKLAVAITVMTGLAGELKNAAEKNAPDSAYFSYCVNKHKYKSATGTDLYYKYSGYYYVKKDLKGYGTYHKFYEHSYFY